MKKEIIGHVRHPYQPDQVIIVGDAHGDYEAASSNGILFYPICPNDEESSWEDFYNFNPLF